MLTKDDLKEIKKLLSPLEEDMVEVKSDLTGVKGDLGAVKEDLGGVKDDLGSVKADLSGVKYQTKQLEKLIIKNHKELKKEIRYASQMLDKQTVEVSRRVTRIEKHLNLPQN